jgi:Domain of unknown function (DUF397)
MSRRRAESNVTHQPVTLAPHGVVRSHVVVAVGGAMAAQAEHREGLGSRASSYSGDNGGTCVEVGTFGPAVAIRDSNHPDGPQLTFAPAT